MAAHVSDRFFDICITTYDAALAHLRDYNNLAVLSIYFGRSEARTARANVGIRDKFNIESGKAVLEVKEYERVHAENVLPQAEREFGGNWEGFKWVGLLR